MLERIRRNARVGSNMLVHPRVALTSMYTANITHRYRANEWRQ